MTKLLPVVFLAAFAAACSSSPTAPSASNGSTGGTLASTADDTPTGDARNSFPTDAPRGWTFTWQGQTHEDGTMSAFAAWTPVVNIRKYETAFEVYASDNTWKPLPSIFTNTPTKFQVVMPRGRFRARTRSIGDGAQGNWTPFIELSNGWPEHSPVIEEDDCYWSFEGFKFVLRFGRWGRA